MRRAKTPFARCPCTKTAICAVAVNHPHHTNCMNHSSDKCQRVLVHALLPVNPSIRRKRASSPACARPARPRARPSTATRLPSCAQNFFAQSLVNSRELSSISRTRAHTCATPPSAAEGPPARPVLARRRDARGLRQPPVYPVAPKISHPISHILSQSLVHLACLSTPPTAAKNASASRDLPVNPWPSACPYPKCF